MIERFILGTARIDGIMVIGKTTGGDSRTIDHGDDAIDGDFASDVRPVEGGDQRLRQSKARGLDDDMIRTLLALQQLRHGRNEIVGDRAADAAIGKLNDIVFRAGFCAAALQHVAVVDHDPQALC